jgi:hypothetical protein
MTQDEIMKMAHEAGLHIATDVNWMPIIGLKYAEAFAKLIVQHEREIWERRCERLQSLMDIRETQPNKPCCLAEREACAKLLEDTADGAKNVDPNGFVWQAIKKSAELIRARGQE